MLFGDTYAFPHFTPLSIRRAACLIHIPTTRRSASTFAPNFLHPFYTHHGLLYERNVGMPFHQPITTNHGTLAGKSSYTLTKKNHRLTNNQSG